MTITKYCNKQEGNVLQPMLGRLIYHMVQKNPEFYASHSCLFQMFFVFSETASSGYDLAGTVK